MAVRKYVLANLSVDDLAYILSWSETFTASQVSAHATVGHARVKGRLSDEMYEKYSTSEYAVYSYETAIAWHVRDQWYINTDDYSSTSSHHRRLIHEALVSIGHKPILL